MQPQFRHLPEMKVVGLGAKFISNLSPDKNNTKIIPPLWHEFVQQMSRITNAAGATSLGLVEMLDPADKSHPDELFYIACTQVADLNSVPPGMIHRTIPAGRYAAFTHHGKLDSLPATLHAIYIDWLPHSHLTLRPAPHLEIYDHRFNPTSDQSEFDILLPIQ